MWRGKWSTTQEPAYRVDTTRPAPTIPASSQQLKRSVSVRTGFGVDVSMTSPCSRGPPRASRGSQWADLPTKTDAVPYNNEPDSDYEDYMRMLAGSGPRELKPRSVLSSRSTATEVADFGAQLKEDLADQMAPEGSGDLDDASGIPVATATPSPDDELESAVAAFEAQHLSAPTRKTSAAVAAPPKKAPYWVEEAMDAAKPVVPLPLTSLGWLARTEVKENQKVCRDFAKRAITLIWSPDPVLTTPPSGNSFQSSYIEIQPEGEKLTAPAGGVIYIPELEELPGTKPRATSRTTVTSASRDGLPRWKDLPASKRRTFHTREAVASSRFGALSFKDPPTLDDLRSGQAAPEVGLFSVDIFGSRAEKFLDGENESTGLGLCRGLMRALKRDTSDRALMVAVWVQLPNHEATAVRLFLALSLADVRPGWAQYKYDMAIRHARSVMKHGGEVSPGGRLKWLEGPAFAKYYDVPLTHWDDWNDPNFLEEMRRRGLSSLDHAWEYTPENGFPSSEELDGLVSKSLRRTEIHADLLGVPHWMGTGPMDRLCKGLGVKTKDISMYRGSPDQFAALIMKSGEYLGEYCSTGIKGQAAADTYSLMRAQ